MSDVPLLPTVRPRAARAGRVVGTALCHVTASTVRSGWRDRRRGVAVGIGRAATALGPTYIKVGQLISANPVMFPAYVVEAFTHTQDQCPPESFDSVVATIEADLGMPLRSAFESFSEIPLAAGSIAQVHEARLPDGRRVAVKVRRPGLERILSDDLALLTLGARTLERFRPELRTMNPIGFVEDLRATLSEELAFRLEAARMDELRQVFAGWPVVIPEVVHEWTTERVLTMSFVEGVKISNVHELERRGHDLRSIADLAVTSLLHSALKHGVFHGDGHPGNLVVLDDGRLGIYDFGIVGRLEDEHRRHVSRFLRALVLERFDLMAESLVLLADLSAADLGGAIADMAEVTGGLVDEHGQIQLVGIDHAQLLSSFLTIANKHQMGMPTELVLLFKQLLYLNGVANRLDPGLDVFDGKRFFEHYAPDDGLA